MADGYFGERATDKTAVNVNLESVNRKIFDELKNEISSLKNAVKRNGNSITNYINERDKKDRSDETERTNQERRQRAANAALFGKIDKQLSTLEVLKTTIKDAFDSVIDVIKEGFSKSLRSYDEMARELRRQNLSNEVKKYAQTLADRANIGEYKVSRDSAVAVTNFLAQSDTALLKKFTDANATDAQKKLYGEIVNLGAVFKEGGMDESTIAKLLGQINESNLETWRKVALQSRASGSEGAVARQVLTQMMNTPGGIASLGKDIAGGLNSVMQSARTAMSVGGISENLATKFIEVSNKIQSGDIYDIDQDALARALAVAGNKLNNPQALIESFNKQLLDIQRATGTDRDRLYNDLIGKLTPLSTTMPDLVSEMRISAGRALAGNLNEESAEKLEQIKENLEDNRAEGKLNDWIGNITSKINLFTEDTLGVKGGIFGGLATDLDELFGQNIGMDQVVRNGFRTTVDLLKSINFKLTLQSIGNVLSKSGILAKLATKFPFLSKLGIGATGAGATATTTAATTTAATATQAAGKFGTLLKGIKAAGILGTVITVGVAGKEMYDAFTEDQTSYITDESSPAYKNIEKNLNTKATAAKAVGATIKAGLAIGATAAGTKIGATLGAAGGPIGMAIGAGVGAAAGTALGPIIDGYANVEIEKLSSSLLEAQQKYDEINDILDSGNLSPAAQKYYNEQKQYLETIIKNQKNQSAESIVQTLKNQNESLEEDNASKTLNEITKYISSQEIAIAKAEQRIQENSGNAELVSESRTTIENARRNISKANAASLYALGEKEGATEGEDINAFLERVSSKSKFYNYERMSDNKSYQSTGRFGGRELKEDPTEYFRNYWAFFEDQLSTGVGGNDTFNNLENLLGKEFGDTTNGYTAFQESFKAILDVYGVKHDSALADFLLKRTLDTIGKSDLSDKIKLFADGGVVNKATPSIIGEAGKEAVLPLTKPNAMASVLKSLSNDEKYTLIKSLIGSGGNLTKLDFIKALFSAVFGSSSTKQTESAESLVSNELAQNIIAGAAAQKGHSYTEMVCNQLVEAALRYAGFQLPITGVVTKHFNHPSMHLVLNDPVHGISPNDPALLPGMILFSHPFTQAEADQLNRTKGGRRKAGDPGHMGIYAGNGLWWNSTSSKRFVDYSSGNGINSTASGVALTKPYTTGTYKLYAAGYYDGMFGTSETRGLPHATANKSFASDIDSAISSTGLLSDNEIRSIKKSAGNDPAMKQYIDQATKLLTSGNHGDIVAILVEIARYLKGIASAPANKSPLFSASRPNIPVFQ